MILYKIRWNGDHTLSVAASAPEAVDIVNIICSAHECKRCAGSGTQCPVLSLLLRGGICIAVVAATGYVLIGRCTRVSSSSHQPESSQHDSSRLRYCALSCILHS